MISFKSLDLHPSILSSLDKKGYTNPTPIQEMAIPQILNGKDVLGIAQTGTGKTAAFSLPIIQKLANKNLKMRAARVNCLILTPTRELASQIEDNVATYSKGLGISSAVIFGGVGPRPQIQKLSKGLDIVIATPGRLLDLMNDGHVLFDQLETFVLDEADRMLDMGFINDVKKIIKKFPNRKRQTLLFSATMPKDIAKLSMSLLKDPVRVEVTAESSTVEKIEQKVNYVDRGNKPFLLKNILKDNKIKFALVFTRTKHGANKVSDFLEHSKVTVAAIHGNKSQAAREKALQGFRNGKIRVLVATDIAARGIDVSGISHVINYNIPEDPKSYVHRIGRTARAGKEGVAISFCDTSEKKLLKDIEKCIKYKIPVDENHEFHGQTAKQSENSALRVPKNNNRTSQKATAGKKPFNKKKSKKKSSRRF